MKIQTIELVFCTATFFAMVTSQGILGRMQPRCYDKSSFCPYYSPSSFYCSPRFNKYWAMMRDCKRHCSICTNQCGLSQSASSRVIGGVDARPGQWPWNVAVWRNNKFKCGGVLINSEYVLTSAACLTNARLDDIKVSVGETDITKRDGERFIGIHRMVFHPYYVGGKNYGNDIALLELKIHARFDKRVQPVCLPSFKSSPRVGTICYLTGWGKKQFNGGPYNNAYPHLQQVGLKISSNSACHLKNYKGHPVSSGMICGSPRYPHGHHGACLGDFGSPLVCRKSNGAWELHGIVSWISSTCNTDLIDTVFTRISAYRNWIDNNARS